MHTRRTFLTAASALTLNSMLPSSVSAASAGDGVFTNASLGAYTQGLLTQAHFEKLLGTLFMVFLPSGNVSYLRLHKVVSCSTNRKDSLKVAAKQTIASFSLSFHSADPTFTQGSYLLDHGTLGRFAVFLVQGATTPGAATFEATFTSL